MIGWRERELVGRAYLDAITTLLQRARGAHPTAGLFEAADLNWWWGRERPTDRMPQLVWFDGDGRPVAAVVVTDHGSRTSIDPLFMPHPEPEQVADVVGRGLANAAHHGLGDVELEVDPGDAVLREVLGAHGFEVAGAGLFEGWLAARDRPPVSPLHDGYRLATRLEMPTQPHHFAKRNGAEVEQRLRETPLYRSDLDLVVLDGDGQVAAMGLFWFDAATATGLVEPMRTEEEHQRRGLARHVLTAGVDRLAAAGAERIKICWEEDNPASGHLYRGVGFVPFRQTLVMTGRIGG